MLIMVFLASKIMNNYGNKIRQSLNTITLRYVKNYVTVSYKTV
jgi:hypothetical protein